MEFKKFLPHLLAIAILLAISAVFFAPNFFGGKVLPQPDNEKARAIQTEIQQYIKKDGEAPLWTNSLFGGMPSFQIYTTPHGNLTKPLVKALFLWTDASDVWASVFVAMFCMYLLLVVMRVDWRAAMLGAVAFGITTYNVDILEAGHSTKMAALALAPGMMAGLVLLFNKRWYAGTGLLALFTSMEIYVNHVQITYYTLLLLAIYGIARFVQAIRNKTLPDWAKAAGLSVVAMILGVACNTAKIWPTYEYSKETIRGGSELTAKAHHTGLDPDYLFGWSSGICESGMLLIPHAAGGGSGENYMKSDLYGEVAKNMPDDVTPQQLAAQISRLFYTGEQPFVGTAIYFGIVAFFLFIFGAVLVRKPAKWWLVIGAVFMVSLAWGKHFALNTDVWYNYLPLFNMFRAPTMAFGMAQLCVAALAALGLQQLFGAEVSVDSKKRALYISLGITLLLLLMAYFCAPHEGLNDGFLDTRPELKKALVANRVSWINSDFMRALGFIAVTAGLIWLYLRGLLKSGVAVLAITALALADHWMICRRTLDDSKYTTEKAATALPRETPADQKIKADPDPDFRVLDLNGGDIATNYRPSFFYKNIGGYHAAKLQRFQEVVDTFLSGGELGKSLHILGMMNVKYVINKNTPMLNSEALGNAWFVHHFDIVPNGDAELAALRYLHPRDTAVFQEKYADMVRGKTFAYDSTAYIKLASYHPDKMVYEYSANTPQLAIFSEMYYPPAKGWKCYLNGKPAPDFTKVNYLLRAMVLPPGQKQQLEMRFEPRSYYLGEKIAFAASAATLLICLAALFFWYKAGTPVGDPSLLSDPEQETKSPKKAHAAPKKKK